MAHHKRRKRKAFKGHCTLCSYRSTNGTRNGRLLTPQERSHRLKLKEGLEEAAQQDPQ